MSCGGFGVCFGPSFGSSFEAMVARMPEMTALATAQHIANPIRDVGGKWMLHADTLGPCKDFGYKNGFVYYVVGRGGVLGDVDADVIAAAFGFFEPQLVRLMWEGGVNVEGARQAGHRYGAACASFGRARVTGFTNAARYCELAEKLIAGISLTGLSLFAGWKAEPLPDDSQGRAYFLTHVLREWRGSAHIVGVAASGLSPLEAVLTSGGGSVNAKMFGWGEDHPDVTALAGAREHAEHTTDAICAAGLEAALSGQERAEFAGLVTELAASLKLD